MRPSEQTHGTDARIAELTKRQHGVVAHGQLVALGVLPGAIKRRVVSSRLHRLHPGVYAVGHRVLSREARWLAAVLACGEGAVLSHWSAAAHWGIRGPRGGTIHITSPSKTRSCGLICRHRALLPADEITVEAAIPVTTAPRTIFDLAAISDQHVVESAIRESEYLRLHDRLSLWELLARYPGHRGNVAIRAALAALGQTGGETRSALEDRFLSFLDAYHLPRPQLNAWIPLADHRYKADCLWPAQRHIVELDSWQAHATRSAFQSDKSRDRRLQVAGYTVTRVTWHQLDHEAAALASDLRALLRHHP